MSISDHELGPFLCKNYRVSTKKGTFFRGLPVLLSRLRVWRILFCKSSSVAVRSCGRLRHRHFYLDDEDKSEGTRYVFSLSQRILQKFILFHFQFIRPPSADQFHELLRGQDEEGEGDPATGGGGPRQGPEEELGGDEGGVSATTRRDESRAGSRPRSTT